MIKRPSWAKGAHPTVNGWVKNGELLKSQKISQKDIDEFNGKTSTNETPKYKELNISTKPLQPKGSLFSNLFKRLNDR